MLMAFISDIHGNLPALEAATADAKARGADRIICAGDVTGYGPFPDDVCRFLQRRHIPSLVGNYDQKVIAAANWGKPAIGKMKSQKRKILMWTVRHISQENRLYLAGLPDHLDLQIPSGHKIQVVHGSPVSNDDAIYPSLTGHGLERKIGDARPDALVCGHTHIPFVRRIGGILVVNCSSVGHPVDGDPRPAYALVHAERGKPLSGRIIRFDYDRERTIAALQKSSLPKGLCNDFAEGNKRRFLE